MSLPWLARRRNSGLDPESRAFLQKVLAGSGTSIARDRTLKLQNLFRIIKGNTSSWGNVRIWPQSINAGTGSIVYTSGGWSTDNHTLVGSPTWGSTGIDYNGTSQYGLDANDLWPGSTALTVFHDFIQDTLTTAQSIFGASNTVSNQRGFGLFTPAGGANYSFNTSANGTAVTTSTFGAGSAGAQRSLFCIYSPSSLVAYVNGVVSTVTTSPTASIFNSTAAFAIGAGTTATPINFFDGKIATVIAIKETLTVAQALAINAAMEALR